MPKNKTQKQIHPTKEELIKMAEQKKETIRLRALVKEKLYPILLKGSTSVANAEQMCQIVAMSVQQAFMADMKGKKISDLKICEKLDPKAPQSDYYAEILDLVQDETVASATRIIEGLGDEIKRLQKKEMSERKLETLKTDFIE